MERSVDNGFNDWWSQVLGVHDYAPDPFDVEHF